MIFSIQLSIGSKAIFGNITDNSYACCGCLRLQRYRIGLAMNTEEYVPTNIPKIRAKANVLISSPELVRKKRTKTINNVVKDVTTVRLSD